MSSPVSCPPDRRRRPDWRWGVFTLPGLWGTLLFAGLLIWRTVRDRQAFVAIYAQWRSERAAARSPVGAARQGSARV